MSETPTRLLLVDDDEDVHLFVSDLIDDLADWQATLSWVTTSEEARESLRSGGYDAALIDQRLGAESGVELIREIVSMGVETPCILLTSSSSRALDLAAMAAGAADFLAKERLDASALERAVRHAIENRRREAVLRDFLGNITDLVQIVDAAGAFVSVNRAWVEALGYDEHDIADMAFLDVVHPDHRDECAALFGKLADGETLVHVETVFVAKDGGAIRVSGSISPRMDESGTFLNTRAIFRDVTEAHARTLELVEAKEAAERASQVRGAFLSNMSHELRNPLNSILGFSRLLRRTGGELTDKQTDFVERITRSAEHMLSLVNDLLDLRRIEQGGPPPEPMPLNVEGAISQAVRMMEPSFSERGHTFADELEAELPRVLANERELVQILVNLLSNASKYTDPGGRITLRASTDGAWVHLSVSDTGIGISREDLPQLFTYWQQVGGKHEHHMQGAGVGLALTRSLVEAMGGTVEVSSRPGEGSTFTVALPLAPAT